MRFPSTFGIAAATAVLAFTAPARAETPLELVGYVKLEKVTTTAAGERQVEWVEPELVVPGDRLIFGTRFANRGEVPIERFVVSNPVPASVSVTAELDPAVLVSVDGGANWGKLAELEIGAPDGTRRAATPGDVTNVRWILPAIAPGESGTLEFPVTVR
ncbi:hypothetical protein CHX26_09645 [Porphyrobacter sp. HT-58-2]|uniref:hypothetical protein n=1 Tax=Porphyrobacter sp. HT-58-2 TaxID=2023229 RepID=UPI000CDC0C8B|nr:hypothetical protein [Porphyrobacter sp. HT-58-2]AUX69728.1 hypothetical protein CHX26_09645 [Porphyrobacter sp. HT-58-2]